MFIKRNFKISEYNDFDWNVKLHYRKDRVTPVYGKCQKVIIGWRVK